MKRLNLDEQVFHMFIPLAIILPIASCIEAKISMLASRELLQGPYVPPELHPPPPEAEASVLPTWVSYLLFCFN